MQESHVKLSWLLAIFWYILVVEDYQLGLMVISLGGSTHFDLSMEQIAQKTEKLQRTQCVQALTQCNVLIFLHALCYSTTACYSML